MVPTFMWSSFTSDQGEVLVLELEVHQFEGCEIQYEILWFDEVTWNKIQTTTSQIGGLSGGKFKPPWPADWCCLVHFQPTMTLALTELVASKNAEKNWMACSLHLFTYKSRYIDLQRVLRGASLSSSLDSKHNLPSTKSSQSHILTHISTLWTLKYL